MASPSAVECSGSFVPENRPGFPPQENTWTELLVEFAFIAPYRRSVADPSRRGHYLRGVHFAILIFASRDGFFRRRFLPFLPFLSPGGALPRQPPPSVSSVRSAFFVFCCSDLFVDFALVLFARGGQGSQLCAGVALEARRVAVVPPAPVIGR